MRLSEEETYILDVFVVDDYGGHVGAEAVAHHDEDEGEDVEAADGGKIQLRYPRVSLEQTPQPPVRRQALHVVSCKIDKH